MLPRRAPKLCPVRAHHCCAGVGAAAALPRRYPNLCPVRAHRWVLLIIAVLQCSLSSSAAAHQRSQNSHFVAAAAVSVRCGCLAARPGSPTLSSSSVLQLWQSHTCPSSAACQASICCWCCCCQSVLIIIAAGVSCHSARYVRRHYQSLLVPAHCRQQNIAVAAAAAIAANRTAWPPSPRSPTGTVIAAPKTVLNSTNVGLTAHYNL